jgi:hypothetical protein
MTKDSTDDVTSFGRTAEVGDSLDAFVVSDQPIDWPKKYVSTFPLHLMPRC